MKTKAVRLYGQNDIRLEEFELPEIQEDEILARVVSDSICMSSYKALKQGAEHKRVPDDVAENPTLIGHEFCGEIIRVGQKWQSSFREGQKFSIQPALNYQGSLAAPGYSYQYIGGDATYIIIPNEVMEMNCLLDYTGKGFFPASLSEPMSCIVGAFHANYHTQPGTYAHTMDIKEGGTMAILAGVGPMGMGAIDYALHREKKPSKLVVTDIDESRLSRAKKLYTQEHAKENGVELIYVNTKHQENPVEYLLSLTENQGYDDVLVMAPVKQVVEQADGILGRDGCLNFFAGPSDHNFKAELNFFNVHYNSTHLVGTSGGNTDDMREALAMMSQGKINPSAMITHIGGLNSVIPTTSHLPEIPGGKKLIYTNIEMELTAISEFEEKGKNDPLFKELHEIVKQHNGLWSIEAEEYLLNHSTPI